VYPSGDILALPQRKSSLWDFPQSTASGMSDWQSDIPLHRQICGLFTAIPNEPENLCSSHSSVVNAITRHKGLVI
jgi:hypothetical protein